MRANRGWATHANEFFMSKAPSHNQTLTLHEIRITRLRRILNLCYKKQWIQLNTRALFDSHKT